MTGTVRVFRQTFTLDDANEVHAFGPLEALLPCVWQMAFLSGGHASYRLAL
jgi:hypothetical protein